MRSIIFAAATMFFFNSTFAKSNRFNPFTSQQMTSFTASPNSDLYEFLVKNSTTPPLLAPNGEAELKPLPHNLEIEPNGLYYLEQAKNAVFCCSEADSDTSKECVDRYVKSPHGHQLAKRTLVAYQLQYYNGLNVIPKQVANGGSTYSDFKQVANLNIANANLNYYRSLLCQKHIEAFVVSAKRQYEEFKVKISIASKPANVPPTGNAATDVVLSFAAAVDVVDKATDFKLVEMRDKQSKIYSNVNYLINNLVHGAVKMNTEGRRYEKAAHIAAESAQKTKQGESFINRAMASVDAVTCSYGFMSDERLPKNLNLWDFDSWKMNPELGINNNLGPVLGDQNGKVKMSSLWFCQWE